MVKCIHTAQLGEVLVSQEMPAPPSLTKVLYLPEEPVLPEQDLVTSLR